jgi:hypothetical protein
VEYQPIAFCPTVAGSSSLIRHCTSCGCAASHNHKICPRPTSYYSSLIQEEGAMPIHKQLAGKSGGAGNEKGIAIPFLCSKAGALPSCATPRLGLISLTAAIRLSPSQMPVRGG